MLTCVFICVCASAGLRATSPPPKGMLRGDELSAAYASADVFVMPSETETLGFVVLEVRGGRVATCAGRCQVDSGCCLASEEVGLQQLLRPV